MGTTRTAVARGAIALVLFALTAAPARTARLQSAPWTVQVLEVLRAERLDRAPLRFTEPRAPEGTDHLWIVLTLEITPPAKGSGLRADEIVLRDATGNRFPLQGYCVPLQGSPNKFFFFDDTQLFLEGQQTFDSRRDGRTILKHRAGDLLEFSEAEPSRILLAFDVPETSSGLVLGIADLPGIELP